MCKAKREKSESIMKICHVTSAHPQEDVRIFHKECVSLAAHGYETYQVSCGKTYMKSGVHLIGVECQSSGRLRRMTKTVKAIYDAALKVDADIYHIHDPELLPYALKLKKRGKKVIFDSHEEVPAQILDKAWIPVVLRKPISLIYAAYETYAVKKIDAVITVTPHIVKKFEHRAQRVALVQNYPKTDEIVFHGTPFDNRAPIVCYAGGISTARGEDTMINAMENINGKLVLAGIREDTSKVQYNENKKVCYIGKINRDEINDLYGKSVAGLVVLKPAHNYIKSLPIKMFEYMAAGLPVIASDFPLWMQIIKANNCGICVNPNDTRALERAIKKLLDDRELAQKMGENGRKIVLEKYSWSKGEENLFGLYEKMEKS